MSLFATGFRLKFPLGQHGANERCRPDFFNSEAFFLPVHRAPRGGPHKPHMKLIWPEAFDKHQRDLVIVSPISIKRTGCWAR